MDEIATPKMAKLDVYKRQGVVGAPLPHQVPPGAQRST